jgi:hypothetical protein
VAGRLMVVTNANLEVVSVGRDAAGNVTNLVDGLNRTNTWNRNQQGWVMNKVDANGNLVFTNEYNANGWLTAHWTPGGGTASYSPMPFGNYGVTDQGAPVWRAFEA